MSYMILKGMDRDPSKYPLSIDVKAAESEQQSVMVLINIQSNGEIFSSQDMSSNIRESNSRPIRSQI